MKIDTSKILFETYDILSNKLIKITLKNGEYYRCVITGYYYGSFHFIEKWSIHEIDEKINFISDESFFFDDVEIRHIDIKSTYFYENNSTLQF